MTEQEKIDRARMFWSSNDVSWHPPETVAAVTELSTNTLVNWRAMGKGPDFVKSGKLIYYRKCDIIKWFESFAPSNAQAA
jgi:hypothetical protein